MKNRPIVLASMPFCLAAAAYAVPQTGLTDASVAPPSASVNSGRPSEQKSWYFSGTVRYVCDVTKKETYKSFSGITAEMTREQAMEFAKEAGAADGARWGRVVSVNVSTLF